MKKIFLFALIGLGMSLVSCTKEETVADVNFNDFKVEISSMYDHKTAHRGNEPLVINKASYSTQDGVGKGLISTNYADIPVQFTKIKGVKVTTRMYNELLTYDNPFFLHGGYIILSFSYDDITLRTDSIRFDIIATSDKIDEWARGGIH